MGEFAAIDRIRRLLAGEAPSVASGDVGIGDDAAVVDGLLLAIDTLVAGVHFPAREAKLEDVGWKSVVVNASDIAAMGGRPRHCVVSVAGPPDIDLQLLYRGIAEASAEYHCPVVGGDLTNAGEVMVTVAMTGAVDGAAVLRSGARAGDKLYVTGPLGAAAASGWTIRPRARVEEGVAARRIGATAMIDVSDGLAADVGHLATASDVGVVLEDVPVAPGATLEQALGGGEDFELVFAVPAGTDVDFAVPLGRCTDDVSQRPDPAGWEHRFS